jgi:[ribosomal protein S5]-alanine N-acetyltransferase
MTMSSCPTLQTPRLTLKPIDKSNAESLFSMWNSDGLAELSGIDAPTDVALLRSGIEYFEQMNTSGLYRKWSIFSTDSNRLIGECEAYPLKPQIAPWEEWGVGYTLEKKSWRQGLMFEALSCVLSHVFEQSSTLRVKADVGEWNTPSIKLLEKLGFHHEGLQRSKNMTQGQAHDMKLLALTRKHYLMSACHESTVQPF